MANTFSQGPYAPSDGQVHFNTGGATTGSANFTYDSATNTLTFLGANIIFGGAIPTSDPTVAGQLYLSSGALKVSAG